MENQNVNPQQHSFLGQQNLPNATAVLVLGILSIVTCCFYGFPGLICGIIALVLAKKDLTTYKIDPQSYTQSSYKNVKAGKVCAIVGVSLAALMLVYIIGVLAFFGTAILSNPQEFFQQYK